MITKINFNKKKLSKIRLIFFIFGIIFIALCQLIKNLIKNLTDKGDNWHFNFVFLLKIKLSYKQDLLITIISLIVLFLIIFVLLLNFLFSANFFVMFFCGGLFFPGISNLIDRFLYKGAVIDYLKIGNSTDNFLWFNLEDIFLGLFFLFFVIFIIFKMVQTSKKLKIKNVKKPIFSNSKK